MAARAKVILTWVLILSGLAAALPAPALVPALTHSSATVGRDLQPVVLKGAQLPGLAVVANYVERPPTPFSEERQDGLFLPWSAAPGQAAGTPVGQIFAFRWQPGGFVEIPVQVDEMFPRYLTNYASGFGIYSQADVEMGYVFDAEGVRKTAEVPGDPATAAFPPGARFTPDPVSGFDSDDEVVFMARDAGLQAPAGVNPAGLDIVLEVALLDVGGQPYAYAYLGRSATLQHTFASHVAYARDADADTYVQSNHGGYGGAPGGACYSGDGVDAPLGAPQAACDHRRPKDSAMLTTPTYQFHYAGRWKMDGLRFAQPHGDWSGSIVDRWKGRAYQQRDGNVADIGGFENENDWTLSSVTLGEKAGPVRVLRETWGADSGTHVTRTELFYRDFFVQRYAMRVHPLPPDGVYAFWDHQADMVDTYYTQARPDGVPVDGVNDELYGTNSEWQDDVLGETAFAVDVPDPTFQGATAAESWDEVTGPWGSMVSVIHIERPSSVVLSPYYRDDAGFDDGTGHDPQPQGSFGAHGIHFFFAGDSDNAFLPIPVDEFIAEDRQYLFSGRMPNVGGEVLRLDAAPLVAWVTQR